MTCIICKNQITKDTDAIYLCEHKEGIVHANCCQNLCSWDHKPCNHRMATFRNMDS